MSGGSRLRCRYRLLVIAGALLLSASPVAALPSASTAPPRWVRTALRQLARLPVKAPVPMTGYSRARFGPAWADTDGNHCDTRDDILKRDLRKVTFKTGSTCVIASGALHDPYTGKKIAFARGVGTSTAVQIDHVVALADAWRTGAATWPATRRLRSANDRSVLLAVDGPANEAKSDDDASQWLPSRTAFRCRYVARQLGIKSHYHLWLTKPKHDAIAAVLSTCS